MAIIALCSLPANWHVINVSAWISLAYVSIFSMLVGFIFWYRGLALGGIASVGQLQLLQPFFGLIFATVFLHEPITWTMVLSTVVVVLCVASAKRFT
jgi:drug/metabolite transporter (DMT)-like permease